MFFSHVKYLKNVTLTRFNGVYLYLHLFIHIHPADAFIPKRLTDEEIYHLSNDSFIKTRQINTFIINVFFFQSSLFEIIAFLFLKEKKLNKKTFLSFKKKKKISTSLSTKHQISCFRSVIIMYVVIIIIFLNNLNIVGYLIGRCTVTYLMTISTRYRHVAPALTYRTALSQKNPRHA